MSSEKPLHLDAETLEHLRRLAHSRPEIGRGHVAKLGAIRTLERLECEARRRQPEDEQVFPWEFGGPPIELYLWSEIERALFGHLPGTGEELRNKPAQDKARIQAVYDLVMAADDPAAAFRRWYLAEVTRQAQAREENFPSRGVEAAI